MDPCLCYRPLDRSLCFVHRDRAEVPIEFGGANLLPLMIGVLVYVESRSRRWGESTILASPTVVCSLSLVVASMVCLPDDVTYRYLELYRLAIAHIVIAGAILVIECGGRGEVSPGTRLAGAVTMTIFAVLSWSIFNINGGLGVIGLPERVARTSQ